MRSSLEPPPSDSDAAADRGDASPAQPRVDRVGREAATDQPGKDPRGWFARLYDRFETRMARLSARSNFWHRICSSVWLPFAFRSGIKIKKISPDTFWAVLPFTRFNRNWYRAMAGASLLGNSEIAGGMYVFGQTGGRYTVVCKQLEYRFLRPCFGPAIYRVEPRESLAEKLETGEEFNVTLDLTIAQVVNRKNQQRERRVGQCVATYHVTPLKKARRRAASRR